ncbi:glycosyltransferase [Vibrio mediterranei]|uniref:glycosyltransferase n=1 Tax=Vibrio mediterranei TaxID=689 RepID=UPI00148C9BAF|nr:glycosyltransferase [Vibrio mediterranei]NOH29030.1 glycosyltransferase [Vibrio mediterranei]
MTMLSIITVTYNNAEGLRKTFNSLLVQTELNIQWIIKDGGSNDETLSILEEIKENVGVNILVEAYSSKDNGIYDAMNFSLSKAVGKYVLFLNAGDELYKKNTLQSLYNYLMHNDLDILFASTEVDVNGGAKYIRKAKPVKYIEYGQPAIHQSTVYRTSLHLKYLYDCSYVVSSDYATTLEMIFKSNRELNIESTNEITISKFEVINDSTSIKKQSLSRLEMRRAQKEILNLNPVTLSIFSIRRLISNYVVKLLLLCSKFSELCRAKKINAE